MVNLRFLHNHTCNVIYRMLYYMIAIPLSREYPYFVMSYVGSRRSVAHYGDTNHATFHCSNH
jgi:hypothetical protein